MNFHFQLPAPSVSTLASHIIKSSLQSSDLNYVFVCSLLAMLFITVTLTLARYVRNCTRLQQRLQIVVLMMQQLFCDKSVLLNAEPMATTMESAMPKSKHMPVF